MAAAAQIPCVCIDPDAQLMLAVRAGDTGAFEVLVRKHRPGVIQFLFNIVHDRSIAEELCQDAFLRLYITRERYQPTARFTSWLYLIARHLGLNWLRDHMRERNVEYIDAHRPGRRAIQLRDGSADLTDHLIRKVQAEDIRHALHRLPERQRIVVMMSKFAGHDCVEIAEKLQCSHQAVRSMLFRAYATLREALSASHSDSRLPQRASHNQKCSPPPQISTSPVT